MTDLLNGSVETGGGLSLRDRLRERRDSIRADSSLELTIPGYDGELAVRYKAIPESDMEQYAKRVQKTGGSTRDGAQLLVLCCDVLLGRENGKLIELEDETGEPIRFDDRLAGFLGFDADSAVDVVIGVFSPDGIQPLAIGRHVEALSKWMAGETVDADEQLLGE